MVEGILPVCASSIAASWIARPAAATIPSDFGAEVIKLEPPGAGDPWRAAVPVPGKATDYWWQLTARKQAQPGDRSQASRRARGAAPPARIDRTSSSPTSPCRCASA